MTGPTTTPSTDAIDLGPEDSCLTVILRGTRSATRSETVAVAVHRRFGVFTHVYVAVASPVRGEAAVHLVRVLEGERVGEAVDWALATLAARGALIPARRPGALAPG